MTFAEGTARDPTRNNLTRLAAYYHVAPSDAVQIMVNMLEFAAQMHVVARGLAASRATVAPIIRRLQEIARALGCDA